MEAYLRQHPPARDQFRNGRRAKPTGLIVVHTAESILDTIGPDTGAENVANFIRTRSTPGSYHDLVDSDSAIKVVRYSDEAYQDGTGSNPFALSISFACRTTDWTKMPAAKRAAFLKQGAVAYARQQAWLKANGYPTTPLARVSRTMSSAGHSGFISHGERDPDRRSDPGVNFPWVEFFTACRAATSGAAPAAPVTELEKEISAMGTVIVIDGKNHAQFLCSAATRTKQHIGGIQSKIWRTSGVSFIDDKVTTPTEREQFLATFTLVDGKMI